LSSSISKSSSSSASAPNATLRLRLAIAAQAQGALLRHLRREIEPGEIKLDAAENLLATHGNNPTYKPSPNQT
jgi:hypothetical protein